MYLESPFIYFGVVTRIILLIEEKDFTGELMQSVDDSLLKIIAMR